NIHKCGNKLPHPHFVTWNPIPTEKPDFHRPEFFGTLIFK
ncbi:MAG: carbohydrate-binding family 9-like protein, partial [Butyricimonas faecalis]